MQSSRHLGITDANHDIEVSVAVHCHQMELRQNHIFGLSHSEFIKRRVRDVADHKRLSRSEARYSG